MEPCGTSPSKGDAERRQCVEHLIELAGGGGGVSDGESDPSLAEGRVQSDVSWSSTAPQPGDLVHLSSHARLVSLHRHPLQAEERIRDRRGPMTGGGSHRIVFEPVYLVEQHIVDFGLSVRARCSSSPVPAFFLPGLSGCP
jgi:hypothetical protein